LASIVGAVVDGKSSKQPIGRWVPRLTGSNGFQKREKSPLGVFLLKKSSLVSLVVGVLCAAEVIAGIAG